MAWLLVLYNGQELITSLIRAGFPPGLAVASFGVISVAVFTIPTKSKHKSVDKNQPSLTKPTDPDAVLAVYAIFTGVVAIAIYARYIVEVVL